MFLLSSKLPSRTARTQPPALLFLSFTMSNSREPFGSDKRQTNPCPVSFFLGRRPALWAPDALEFPWTVRRLTAAPRPSVMRCICSTPPKCQQSFLRKMRFSQIIEFKSLNSRYSVDGRICKGCSQPSNDHSMTKGASDSPLSQAIKDQNPDQAVKNTEVHRLLWLTKAKGADAMLDVGSHEPF